MGDPALGKLPQAYSAHRLRYFFGARRRAVPNATGRKGCACAFPTGTACPGSRACRRGRSAAPVGIKLRGLQVGPQGIELSARMTKSIFSSDLSTRLVLSAPGGEELRVELTDTNMPTWVPLDMLLDEAAKRGDGCGVTLAPRRSSSTRRHYWPRAACRVASHRDIGM